MSDLTWPDLIWSLQVRETQEETAKKKTSRGTLCLWRPPQDTKVHTMRQISPSWALPSTSKLNSSTRWWHSSDSPSRKSVWLIISDHVLILVGLFSFCRSAFPKKKKEQQFTLRRGSWPSCGALTSTLRPALLYTFCHMVADFFLSCASGLFFFLLGSHRPAGSVTNESSRE